MGVRNELVMLFVFLIVFSSPIQHWEKGNSTTITQDNPSYPWLVSLDNATFRTNQYWTCLEVSYTRYGASSRAEYLGPSILLFLSLDGISWIQVDNHTFDKSELTTNVSKVFRICYSPIHSFPFDVEEGETLFITIEYYDGIAWGIYNSKIRLSPLAIVVPYDIIRPWHFIIDWTVPSIVGLMFLSIFSIFIISRFNRKRIEKELREKIKNEEL